LENNQNEIQGIIAKHMQAQRLIHTKNQRVFGRDITDITKNFNEGPKGTFGASHQATLPQVQPVSSRDTAAFRCFLEGRRSSQASNQPDASRLDAILKNSQAHKENLHGPLNPNFLINNTKENLHSLANIPGNQQNLNANRPPLAEPEHKSSSAMEIEEPKKQPNTDPQMVGEFVEEIFKNLKACENAYLPKPGYMESQKDINEKMRAILVDWLIDVHAKFKMTLETLPLTINLIDRYLDRNQMSKQKLQLLGVSCLLIASKYEDIYPPEVKELVKVTDNAFTKEEIMDMESSVLQSLGFHLTVSYSHVFLDRLKDVEKIPDKPYYFVKFLLELALLDYKMIKYSPSFQAAAALYLVNKIFKRESWSPSLQAETGYAEKELRNCAKDFYASLQQHEKANLTALRRKFSSSKFLEVGKYILEQSN
jgi:Cyclin, N-terminal domain/Cyclin, C-terminal domain